MKTIPLSKNSKTRCGFALVDDEHYDALMSMGGWTLHQKGYAFRFVRGEDGKRRTLKMHHAVMRLAGRSFDNQVDHIDGNKANNQLHNLRPATNQQNQRNRGPNRNNKIGIKGVFKVHNRFRSMLTIDGKKKHLGYFPTTEDAAHAYDRAAEKYFGEFARLNFSPTIAA